MAQDDPPRQGKEEREIFLVLEGGGAKAIVHVGALQAIENTRLDPPPMPTLKIKGVAGTSAGAVVAALIAAGARAREDLIDYDGRSPLLDQLKLPNPTKLFDKGGWRRLRLIRTLLTMNPLMLFILIAATTVALLAGTHVGLGYFFKHSISASITLALWASLYVLARTLLRKLPLSRDTLDTLKSVWWAYASLTLFISVLLGDFFTFLQNYNLQRFPEEFVLFVILGLTFAVFLLWQMRRVLRGLVSTEPMLVHLNNALAWLLASNPDPDDPKKTITPANDVAAREEYERLQKNWVRFKDLRKELLVIAADVVHNRVKIFPSDDARTERVVDALVASQAIPVLFRPRLRRRTILVDHAYRLSSGAFVGIMSSNKGLSHDPHTRRSLA